MCKFGFNFDLEKLTNINLYELIERLIRIFSLNKKNNVYINFFLDFVFEYSTRFKSSITDFLYYWDQKRYCFYCYSGGNKCNRNHEHSQVKRIAVSRCYISLLIGKMT